MTGAEQTEIERKYDVDAGATVPDLASIEGVAAVDRQPGVALDALYYDTEDRLLAGAHVIIRRRTGGADEGWHVKLPADEGRTEVHWPLDIEAHSGDGADTNAADTDAAAPVPREVLDRLADVLQGRAVTPLASIRTTRSLVHLRDRAGRELAEIADDEVHTTDVRNGVDRSWREWEAELGEAAPGTRDDRTRLLDAIEARLVEAGARPSSAVAKIARALGADQDFEGSSL